jgi:hypothetical protein
MERQHMESKPIVHSGGISKDRFVTREVKQMLIGIEGKAEAERIARDVLVLAFCAD